MGFKILEKDVVSAVRSPVKIDFKNGQYFAMAEIDEKLALRVVYEEREKDIRLIITFYPVRRDRYEV
jgi:hypothetical protein